MIAYWTLTLSNLKKDVMKISRGQPFSKSKLTKDIFLWQETEWLPMTVDVTNLLPLCPNISQITWSTMSTGTRILPIESSDPILIPNALQYVPNKVP